MFSRSKSNALGALLACLHASCALWSHGAYAQTPAAPASPTPQQQPAAAPPPAAPANATEAPAAPTSPTTPPSGLVPPQLVEPKDAVYPADAPADQPPPLVVLRLTIETDGHVAEAEIVETAGASFDAAAHDAALQFRFTPAMRDGRPMAARILYRYQFQRPAPPVAEPPIVPPGVSAPLDASPAAAEVPPPSAATPAAPLPVAVPITPNVQEVVVEGQQREVDRLAQSAEAVSVVELVQARRETAPLGEVLSRVPGLSLRHAGGLGSDERLTLDGLSDRQIPTFLDGVPLDIAFFPFGVASFPTSLADHVEIYKGVVPIRFGADALGGAINLVSDRRYENGIGASAQVGSFGEQRFTVNGALRDDPTGLVVNVAGFYDHADNDYDVDVEVPDDRGRLSPARVPRFHDGYRAYGATVEAGVVDRPWAKRLLLRGYAVALEKELQHNTVMTVPYGEAHYGQGAVGATGRYEVDATQNLKLELIAAYAYRTATFVDKSMGVYDWFGERVRERRIGGEIETNPRDQDYWWHNWFGRAIATYHILPTHVLTLVTNPTFTTAKGDEKIMTNPNARDPLTAKRARTTIVTGLEYEANLFRMPSRHAEPPPDPTSNETHDDADYDYDSEDSSNEADYRLQNLLFFKHYYYDAASEEPLTGGAFRDREVTSNRFGIGDGIRVRVLREVQLKVSYEYAPRLPAADEVFGDAILIQDNLTLKPEVSSNANVGVKFEKRDWPIGKLVVEVTGFFRHADQLIVLIGNDRFFTYQNVFGARALGVENLIDWMAPGKFLYLDGSFTFQDFRNTSSEGTFGDFNGDRIPNRPWIFASWGGRFHFENVLLEHDEIEPFYHGRYVNEFFRGWESQGLREFKQTVDAQWTHSIGLTYVWNQNPGTYTATLEVANLFDAKNYDFFGVQKPGRAIYLKITGDLR